MPSSSGDVILPTVLLPAIRLVHGGSLGLLPAMVCYIQRGLRALTEAFCRPPTTKRKKALSCLATDQTQDRFAIHLFDGMVHPSLPLHYLSR